MDRLRRILPETLATRTVAALLIGFAVLFGAMVVVHDYLLRHAVDWSTEELLSQRLATLLDALAAAPPGAVLDGRDIGTVICPEAEVKLYVTASPEVRAHRRWLEVGGDEAQVLAEVIERDRRDAERAVAPLTVAEDALVIDTSDMGISEAVATAVDIVRARIGG